MSSGAMFPDIVLELLLFEAVAVPARGAQLCCEHYHRYPQRVELTRSERTFFCSLSCRTYPLCSRDRHACIVCRVNFLLRSVSKTQLVWPNKLGLFWITNQECVLTFACLHSVHARRLAGIGGRDVGLTSRCSFSRRLFSPVLPISIVLKVPLARISFILAGCHSRSAL